jgi:hypothetical protein
MTDNANIYFQGNAEITNVLKMMVFRDEVTGGW